MEPAAVTYPTSRSARLRGARWHPLAALLACVLCAGGVAASWRFAQLAYYDDLTTARATVALQLDHLRGDLSRELFASLNLSDGLVTLVSLHGKVDPGEYQALAAAVVRRSATIRNVAVAQGTTIRFVYPLKGNEAALGVDYMALPNQRATVLRAINERRTVVAGPLALIQGGTGIIGRTPIFYTPSSGPDAGRDTYWGIAATVIDFDRLIQTSRLDQARGSLSLALRGLDGTGNEGGPFWGDADVFRSRPVTLDVPLPSGSWVIAGAPRDGWPVFTPERSVEFLGGTGLSLALSALSYLVLRVSRHRKLEVLARERAEQQLRLANEERMRALAEVERSQRLSTLSLFAGGVAHDVNNLLAGIFGNIELARTALDGDHPAVPHLETASTAFERARDLTRRLLTFAVSQPPERRRLALLPFLRECCGLSLSGTANPWHVDADEGLWDVFADANQLSQVFANLLVNARQAMPQGGRVLLTARNRDTGPGAPAGLPAGRYVEVVVADEGPGIPADVLPRVFEPFFTTKATGSGLGLAMAYSIMAAHGGRIEAGAADGGGASFSLFLPAMAAVEAVARPAVLPAALAGSSNGRILVMDDEQLVRDMAARMLMRGGYDVVAVRDGQSAIAACREALEAARPFDAAILDLTVPGGMGGREALVRLREVQPALPVVFSSGYGEGTAMPGDCQPTAILPKPYQMHELLACTRAVVQRVPPPATPTD